MQRLLGSRTWLAAVCSLAMALTGCAAGAGIPRMRLGSLPFPGVFSLYEAADPEDLGVHCAGSPLARLGHAGERERGTLYTRHAGFIDLSHVRESIDWVRYLHTHTLEAMLAMDRGEPCAPVFTFDCCQARFDVTVSRPDWWGDLPPDERSRLIDEASIRASERLSVVVSTWHEIATWYGYQTIPAVTERGSAFTWDDSTAHVFGAVVGGSALRDPVNDWDHAVTIALDKELHELDVVSRAEQDKAAALVQGRWWQGWVAVRRDLEVGLENGTKTGWLVPECGTEARVMVLPDLADVFGRDLRPVVTFRVVPARWLMRRLMNSSEPPESLGCEAGILDAVERVRASMREEFGDGFDQP